MSLTDYGPRVMAPLVTCETTDVPHPRNDNCAHPVEAGA